MENEELESNKEYIVQLRLEEPIISKRNDRFILRLFSPLYTIGGGYIIDPNATKKKRFNNFDIEQIKTLDNCNFKEYIYNYIDRFSDKFYLEKNEEYKVEADVTLLQQAIRALIENAIKYSEEKTNIYIESIIKDGKKGIVSIRDEGVGISEEDTKRIFDRFYRVDDSRTKATGGTGLGLAIVKRIVEIHKGEIEILSELGKGTKISIILPLATIETEKKNQKIRNEKRNNMKS